MSPVANSTAAPLIEALPQQGTRVKGKHRTHSSAAENSAQPSFEEVKASLPRHPANQQGGKGHRPIDTTLPVVVSSNTAGERGSVSAAGKPHMPIDTNLTTAMPSHPAGERGSVSAAGKPHMPIDTTFNKSRASIASAAQNQSDTVSASGAVASSPIVSHGSIPSPIPASSEAGLAVVATPAGDGKGSTATANGATENAISVNAAAAKSSVSVSKALQLGASVSAQAGVGEQSVAGRRPSPGSNLTAEVASAHRGSVSAKVTSPNASFETVVSRSGTAHEAPSGGSIAQINATNSLQHLDNLPSVSAPLTASAGETVASAPLGQLGPIVAQVVREGNLPRTITIALEPKELGQLQLQVTSNGGEIQVHIQVADPLTRGMVSQQLADLTSTLHRDLGFGGQHGGSQQEPPQPSGGVIDLGAVATIDTPIGSHTTPVAHSLIDVRL